MKQCPVCKAKCKGQPICRRCRSDLSDLKTLEKQADVMMVYACKYLREGNIEKARRFCTHSANLNGTEFNRIFGNFLENFSGTTST